ncbi:hypothetical protein [Planomonospora algeriensis]
MRSVPPPSTGPAAAVQAALVLQVCAVTALTVFEQARGERLAHEIAALGGDPHAPGAQALVGPVTVFAVLVILVAATTAAAGVAHLVWLARARRYAAEITGVRGPGPRPAPPPAPRRDRSWRAGSSRGSTWSPRRCWWTASGGPPAHRPTTAPPGWRCSPPGG